MKIVTKIVNDFAIIKEQHCIDQPFTTRILEMLGRFFKFEQNEN